MDVSMIPKTNISYLRRHQGTQIKSRELRSHFQNLLFLETSSCQRSTISKILEKTGGGPNIPGDPSDFVLWKAWIRDQSFPETMESECGNMGSIFPKKHLHLWTFETKKRRDQSTKKLRNEDTKKRRHQETLKPANFETWQLLFTFKGIPHPQHSDSHPCTRSPLGEQESPNSPDFPISLAF